MAASTPASIQALIVAEVGDSTDGYLANYVSAVWDSYADKALIAPRLQECYSKRRLIALMIGRLRESVDFQIQNDLGVKQSQKIDHLSDMSASVQKEIQRIEERARANRGVKVGSITAIRPQDPPQPGVTNPDDMQIDSNDPRYQGDPYRRPPLGGAFAGETTTTRLPPY